MSPQQPHITLDLGTLLFGGCDDDGRPIGHPMQARRHLLRLGLSRSAADFLALALWWWLYIGRRAFYKFNVPCPRHPSYREGDSWCEELGICETTLQRARALVATRIGRGVRKKEVLGSGELTALLTYYQRADNRTIYEVNEPLLCTLLSEALEIQVVMGSDKTIKRNSDKAERQGLEQRDTGNSGDDSVRFTALPLYRFTASETASEGPGVSRASHKATNTAKAQEGAMALLDEPRPTERHTALNASYPQNDASIRNGTRVPSLMELPPVTAPFSSIQLKEEEIKKIDGKETESVRLTALALENEGVFAQPALEIAVRACKAGLDVEATLELFWAHKAHAASSGRVRDPLAAATRRLQHGALKMPKGQEGSGARAEFRRALRSEALER